jgi:hypothetical protein
MTDSTIHHDKHVSLLAQLGRHVKDNRTHLFNEPASAFATRVSSFNGANLTESDVCRIEAGDGTMPLSSWLSVWQIFQSADKVVSATKSDASLFLASAQRNRLSEADVKQHTPKGHQ